MAWPRHPWARRLATNSPGCVHGRFTSSWSAPVCHRLSCTGNAHCASMYAPRRVHRFFCHSCSNVGRFIVLGHSRSDGTSMDAPPCMGGSRAWCHSRMGWYMVGLGMGRPSTGEATARTWTRHRARNGAARIHGHPPLFSEGPSSGLPQPYQLPFPPNPCAKARPWASLLLHFVSFLCVAHVHVRGPSQVAAARPWTGHLAKNNPARPWARHPPAHLAPMDALPLPQCELAL